MASPLLSTAVTLEADATITAAEVATIIELAHRRRARTVVIGSGRSTNAIETTRAIGAAWDMAGGQILDAITWPEIGASWLRQATRFASADPDLWIMTGPATGWAQMTRRLLWSTHWTPSRTLATSGIGNARVLALVGLANLNGLTGAAADGSEWSVSSDALTP
ncbi:hypothetical protein [Antricoccus suffuscus]|uniref:hypothetical protein n=1 Tax=Antricoccus suffuscus TaxID=1629062 RepID=UPI000D07A9C8|nr:hypothetical protein [Antricoccus suffuscus]